MKNKANADPAASTAAPADDEYIGKGGSYVRDPATGLRVPSEETKKFHKTEGKVTDEQENP